MTPRNYAKLCNADTLTAQLIAAGILQSPTVGFKMFGVSVDLSPNTTVWVIDSLSVPDGVTIDNVVAAHVNTPLVGYSLVQIFRADGYYRLFQNGTIDIQEASYPFTIDQVVMSREIAGFSGQTVVDILKNGVSLWNLNPGNRPTITAAMGNQAQVIAILPDTLSVATGDRLEMAIADVETGSPQDILLQLFST
jgi:hypothetical protein